MGGGGSTSTVYQSNLPQYAKPYYENLMNRAADESFRPYQTYNQPRLADMSYNTQAGLGMANAFSLSQPSEMNAATDAATRAGAGDIGQNYTAGHITNTYDGPAGGGYQANTFDSQNFDAGVRDQYMSPYMDAVTSAAQRDTVRTAMDEQALRNADFARSGAFGGSRAAVQNQMANNATQNRLSDIFVQGRQGAFENAQQQFERDRSSHFSADQATEQSRQFGFGANEDARRAAAELGMRAQENTEQLRQAGYGLRQQAGQFGLQRAGVLGDLANQRDQMSLSRIKTQLGIGQTREDYDQQRLDLAYNDFVNQRDAERQNLQFYSSLLQGVPVSANQNVTQTSSGNGLTGTLGTLTGLQALYALGGGGGVARAPGMT